MRHLTLLLMLALITAAGCADPDGDDDSSGTPAGDDDVTVVGDDDATGGDDDATGGDDDATGGDDDATGGDDDATGGDDDATSPTDADGDGFAAALDCDDSDAEVHPGAAEVCDGIDNDCDGSIDVNADDASTFYADSDGDGYGDTDLSEMACEAPDGYSDNDLDCNDDSSAAYPGGLEVCDGIDNNCDGATDEPTASGAPTWYADSDGDGYGNSSSSTTACSRPAGYVALSTDCNDSDAAIHPGASEYCDGIDHDCDGQVNEADSVDTSIFYADSDGDSYGNASASKAACSQPAGYVSDSTDCNDGAAAVHPNATELCNAIDDDCDGAVDENSAANASTWYADVDLDGYGDAGASTVACNQPAGYVADDEDCNDQDAQINPEGLEVCDSKDNNCDGSVDETGAWWDTDWSYRIPVTITAPAFDVAGPPVAVEVDFHAALGQVLDNVPFEASSVRVVLQNCDMGQPELPSQYLDGWMGLFEKEPYADPIGDEVGTVAFLYDEDGDYSTLETLEAHTQVQAAIYFGHGVAAPGYAAGVSAGASSLASSLSKATFDASHGGVLSGLTYKTSPSMMSQVDSCCGNSIYTGNWSIDPQDGPGTITVKENGPVFAAVEASGTRSDSAGGYSYRYTYWMFAGRPELWSKVYQVTTVATAVNHSGDFTSGIRPWESVQTNISGSAGALFSNSPTNVYADVSNGTWGVAWAYARAPKYVISMSNYNPYIISVANDYKAAGSGTPVTVPANTAYMDNIVQIVLPHAGAFAGVDNTLQGLRQGTQVENGAVESIQP